MSEWVEEECTCLWWSILCSTYSLPEEFMPELPEVETTRRGLLRFCEGALIVKAELSGKKLRIHPPEDLATVLVQKRIRNIYRRGKYLIFEFSDPSASDELGETPWLLCHLGMSGWFCALKNDDSELPNHSHFILTLDNGYRLVFNDVRRFGLLDWCRASEKDPPFKPQAEGGGGGEGEEGGGGGGEGEEAWREDYRLTGMGVEPLDDQFTPEYLIGRAASRKQLSIKQFIMDNAVVVGIGNIYAAEALFISRIHPLTIVSSLDEDQWIRVVAAVRQVLNESIEVKGTTFRDFVHADGKVGDYSELLRVYGRKNQPCRDCNEILISFRLSARATVYCSNCQNSTSPRKRLKIDEQQSPPSVKEEQIQEADLAVVGDGEPGATDGGAAAADGEAAVANGGAAAPDGEAAAATAEPVAADHELTAADQPATDAVASAPEQQASDGEPAAAGPPTGADNSGASEQPSARVDQLLPDDNTVSASMQAQDNEPAIADPLAASHLSLAHAGITVGVATKDVELTSPAGTATLTIDVTKIVG